MEFPEVATLADELEYRLGTLDDILRAATDGNGASSKIEITSEQLDVLRGISSNFKGLLESYNGHYTNGKGPERKSETELPEDLLIKMSNPEESEARRTSVAFIAQTYGGLNVIKEQDGRRTTNLKRFTGTIINSNVFTKGLVDMAAIGDQSGVNYLPSEFRHLSLNDRLQLARLLSWDNLKSWGFNAFEIDSITSKLGKGNGCPVVMIGWAVLASPYSQVSGFHSMFALPTFMILLSPTVSNISLI